MCAVSIQTSQERLIATITRQLNAEGVPVAKSGRQWWDGQFNCIMSNETYKGNW